MWRIRERRRRLHWRRRNTRPRYLISSSYYANTLRKTRLNYIFIPGVLKLQIKCPLRPPECWTSIPFCSTKLLPGGIVIANYEVMEYIQIRLTTVRLVLRVEYELVAKYIVMQTKISVLLFWFNNDLRSCMKNDPNDHSDLHLLSCFT